MDVKGSTMKNKEIVNEGAYVRKNVWVSLQGPIFGGLICGILRYSP